MAMRRRRRTRTEILQQLAALAGPDGTLPPAHEIARRAPSLLEDAEIYFVSLAAAQAAIAGEAFARTVERAELVRSIREHLRDGGLGFDGNDPIYRAVRRHHGTWAAAVDEALRSSGWCCRTPARWW